MSDIYIAAIDTKKGAHGRIEGVDIVMQLNKKFYEEKQVQSRGHKKEGVFEDNKGLSEDDKLTVYRARKIQKFLSQPFHVAENFTGVKGVYVPLSETIRGFNAILSGRMDDYPENAFFNVGTIDDVVKKAETL